MIFQKMNDITISNPKMDLMTAGVSPYVSSFFSGIICLVFFCLPALWSLPKVPPLKILRRELTTTPIQVRAQAALALIAVIFLIFLFSKDIVLALSVTTALILVLLLAALMAKLLLTLCRLLSLNANQYWQLTFSNIQQRKEQSLMLIIVFSIALMLLTSQVILRSSIIQEWQVGLPKKSENTMLVNITQENIESIRDQLDAEQINYGQIFPTLRGRIVKINGKEPSQQLQDSVKELSWELALTTTKQLPENDEIIEGFWWDHNNANTHKQVDLLAVGVSIDSVIAKRLGINVGDSLKFSIGGLSLDAKVISLRKVKKSISALSFLFLFEPDSLKSFSPTYMASFYLAPEQQTIFNSILQEHPTILVYEFGEVVKLLNKIVDQIGSAIGLVLWLTLLAGCLVLIAAILSSIDSRKQASGLLRALGSPQKMILKSVWLEFSLLGLIAGFIAIFSAEVLLLNLQYFILKTPVQPHYWYWLVAPVLAAIFIGSIGVLSCRKVVNTPPIVVLREACQ